MHQRAMGPEDCEEIDIHLVPKWDRVRQYLTSRRSVRVYINRAIEKEKILQLLDVSRFAPNGANRQVIRWIVVNDPAKVRRISGMTIEWMKVVKEKAPALYEEAKMEVFVESWESGQDRIARGAPCIIMLCAPKDERTAPPAAMIARACGRHHSQPARCRQWNHDATGGATDRDSRDDCGLFLRGIRASTPSTSAIAFSAAGSMKQGTALLRSSRCAAAGVLCHAIRVREGQPMRVALILALAAEAVAETHNIRAEQYYNSFDHRHAVLARIKAAIR